jgi:chromosomal replication initiation ATPase DnaA
MCALGSERSYGIEGRVKPHKGWREALRQVIDPAVALVFEVDPAELDAATRRSPRAAFARQVAMYLTHVVCGLGMTEVGALFSRDRTTVAHACEVVEDRRDDPELDSRVERLVCAVAAVIEALSWRGRSK